MKVLYIDCFAGFTSSMLLGALIDMGASAGFAVSELRNIGIEADIISDRISRSGMEAVFAYAKCISREIDSDFTSKHEILLRNMCDSAGVDYATNENVCQWAAVLSCIDCFGADKIICSPLTDGSGIDQKTNCPVPSTEVLTLLKRYNIPVGTIDVKKELISKEGAVFLGEAIDEFGFLPLGNILCVGYGAGEDDIDGCVNIVRCVLTETEDASLLEGELEMML